MAEIMIYAAALIFIVYLGLEGIKGLLEVPNKHGKVTGSGVAVTLLLLAAALAVAAFWGIPKLVAPR